MELMVVIVILSLTALIVLPRLTGGDDARLRSSSRSLAALVRYLGERGATTGKYYRLHFSLADNQVTVMQRGVDGVETRDTDPFFSRSMLADGVALADLELPRLGKVTEGEVTLDIGPGGLAEHFVVHLKGRGDKYVTIFAYPQGGKVKVENGYVEAAR